MSVVEIVESGSLSAEPAGFVLICWSDLEFCWYSIAKSEERSKLLSLAERLMLCLASHWKLRLLAVSSLDDDVIEVEGRGLPWPERVQFLNHEAFGIE